MDAFYLSQLERYVGQAARVAAEHALRGEQYDVEDWVACCDWFYAVFCQGQVWLSWQAEHFAMRLHR